MLPSEELTRLLPKSWLAHSEIEKTLFKTFLAYAAGDAFGAFYEFSGIPKSVPNELKAKANWPVGGISDDTMLTILTLISLQESAPQSASRRFLSLLHENVDRLRGLGPTTRMALGLEVKPHELSSVGTTNGGMMRTCLVALVFPEKEERDTWLRELISVTHKSELAIRSGLELGDLIQNKESIKKELQANSFPEGVSNSSEETLAAVKYILANSRNLEEVIRTACGLGGDTDTTAAISSAIYSFWNPESDEIFSLPWLSQVNWSELNNAPDALREFYRRVKL